MSEWGVLDWLLLAAGLWAARALFAAPRRMGNFRRRPPGLNKPPPPPPPPPRA